MAVSNEKRLKKCMVDPKDTYPDLSLTKVAGKKIVDIHGYVSAEYGADTPVFVCTKVVFSDGSSNFLEGEHDMAYLPDSFDLEELVDEDEEDES